MNEEKSYYPFRYGYSSNLQTKMVQVGVERIITTTYQKNYVGESGVYLSIIEIRKAEKAYFISFGIALIPLLLPIIIFLFYSFSTSDFEEGALDYFKIFVPVALFAVVVYRIITMPIYKLIGRGFEKSVGINVGDFDWKDTMNCLTPGYRKEWIIKDFQYKKMSAMRTDPSFIKDMAEKGLGDEFMCIL